MTTFWMLLVTVLGMLGLERAAILLATQSPAGRAFIVRNRWLHPNAISFLRMPMGLVTVGLWLLGWQVGAFLWFAGWMITDLTDGTVARRCNLQTESGAWLDPLSDKCMYFPPLLFLAFYPQPHVLPWGWVVALLITDTLGQASRLFVQKKAANSFGKAKTAFITLLLIVAGLSQMVVLPVARLPVLLQVLTISCTLLAFLSLYCKVIPDHWYANSLTMANLSCGLLALAQTHAGHPVRAFILVFVGQFFDLFDGRLARLYGSTRHGPVLDDIADGTSFGLAIGYLIARELGGSGLAWGIAAFYVGCVVYRLIRFMRPTVALEPGVFQGMPSPAGAMLGGSAALVFGAPDLRGVGMAMAVGASLLMISNLRYYHFGRRIWPTLPHAVKLLVFVGCLALANIGLADKNYSVAFSFFCFGLALTYMVAGLGFIARRVAPPPPPPGTPE